MGEEKIEKMYQEAKKALLQVADEIDIDSAVQLNKLLSNLLLGDLEFALEKQIEIQLWKVYRSLIDSVVSSKCISQSKENVVNMVISWLTQLSQALHSHYYLLPHELPLSLSVSILASGAEVQKRITEKSRCSILAFISLRMGDLQRYKGDLELPEKLYNISVSVEPTRGDIWNQLGLMSNLKGNFFTAVYYYIRALHASTVFQQASKNVSVILRKFCENECVTVAVPLQELYLTVLGRLHFMMPVLDDLVDGLGPQILDVRMIVPLLSEYVAHDAATDDEQLCRQSIEKLLKISFQTIINKIVGGADVDSSLLGCLSLLLRVPTVWQSCDVGILSIESNCTPYVDSDYLQYFSCLTSVVEYPVQWSHVVHLINPIQTKVNQIGNKKGVFRKRNGAREASPAYCAGRAPPVNKSGSIFQYIYRQMATLVASASGGGGESAQQAPRVNDPESSSTSVDSDKKIITPEKLASSDEITTFLFDHVVTQEPILSSIQITKKSELKLMLSDVVAECYACPSSCCIRDGSGALVGICLASRPTLFEKQMDRLCAYNFHDEGMAIAVEFLKYLFNRADFVYHCEENGVSKPVFLMLVAVRPDLHHKGYGKALLKFCLNAAIAEKCDGAIALCSSFVYHKLISSRFTEQICKIRYDTYRGMYSKPPICPVNKKNDCLYVLMTRLP